MKKILFLILHTDKQSDRYINLTTTWLNGQDFLFYSDNEDLDKKIIKVTDDNSYRSNEIKFVNIVKQLPQEYLNYEWYYFVDNDTFVNTKVLYDTLDNLNVHNTHGQIINSWPKDKSMSYLSGGAGKLIHHTLIPHMRENLKSYDTGFADVTFGCYMKEFSIKCSDNGLFFSQPPKFYNFSELDIKKSISFHYIKSYDEMNYLFNLCN